MFRAKVNGIDRKSNFNNVGIFEFDKVNIKRWRHYFLVESFPLTVRVASFNILLEKLTITEELTTGLAKKLNSLGL